jgi:uracil-DNA glycosylase
MFPPSQVAILPGQLFKQLHQDWQDELFEFEGHIDSIEMSIKKGSITPSFDKVFRALSKPIPSIKVVIFGQDPYPTAGVAQGLAFSAPSDIDRIPASLKNIFTELHNDLGKPLRSNPDLSDWAEQGVLLLNRILTTKKGNSLSHTNLKWEKVTDQVAEVLGNREVVAVCWGNYAQEVSRFFKKDWLVASAHPSPLSAYRGFFGSKPFSRVNRILEENAISPVHW